MSNYLGETTLALDSAHIADLSTGAVLYCFPVSAGGVGEVMVADGEGNLTFEASNVQPPSYATAFLEDLTGNTTVGLAALGAFPHSNNLLTLVEAVGIAQLSPGFMQNTSPTRAITYLVTVSCSVRLEEKKDDAEVCQLGIKNQGVVLHQSTMGFICDDGNNAPLEVSTCFTTTLAPLEYLQLAFRNTQSTRSIVVINAVLTMNSIT
jgi:hypothetical protein